MKLRNQTHHRSCVYRGIVSIAGRGTIRRENRNSDGSDLCHGEMPDVWQNHGRKF